MYYITLTFNDDEIDLDLVDSESGETDLADRDLGQQDLTIMMYRYTHQMLYRTGPSKLCNYYKLRWCTTDPCSSRYSVWLCNHGLKIIRYHLTGTTVIEVQHFHPHQ